MGTGLGEYLTGGGKLTAYHGPARSVDQPGSWGRMLYLIVNKALTR
jgi:hypothetical protein